MADYKCLFLKVSMLKTGSYRSLTYGHSCAIYSSIQRSTILMGHQSSYMYTEPTNRSKDVSVMPHSTKVTHVQEERTVEIMCTCNW